MSLETAAAKLDALPRAALRLGWFEDNGQPIMLWGPEESHALAVLLRAEAATARLKPPRSPKDTRTPEQLFLEEVPASVKAALTLADIIDPPPPAPLSPLPNQGGNDA